MKSTIEDYITLSKLGQGAYGEVVLAKRKQDDKKVAIKIIDKKFMLKVMKVL